MTAYVDGINHKFLKSFFGCDCTKYGMSINVWWLSISTAISILYSLEDSRLRPTFILLVAHEGILLQKFWKIFLFGIMKFGCSVGCEVLKNDVSIK